MITIGVNRGHNSAVCLMKDNEILFHTEDERLSRIKYHKYPFSVFQKIPQYTNHYNNLCVTGLTSLLNKCDNTSYARDMYTEHLSSLSPSFYESNTIIYDLGDSHHLMHSQCAFYNSGFEEATCIVIDDAGSSYDFTDKNGNPFYGRENTSTYILKYPNESTLIHKKVYFPIEDGDYIIDDNIELTRNISESSAFGHTSKLFGFSVLDAGKVMGMASYGKEDDNIPDLIVDGKVRNDIFCSKDLLDVWIDFDYIKEDNFQRRANWAWKLQNQTQENILKYILRMVETTGTRNVCLSGGYFLNCVANYYLQKNLPKDINLYVEPISSDAGTAMGAAKGLWYAKTGDTTIKKQTHIYYGVDYKYDIDEIKRKLIDEEYLFCKPEYIAKLLSNNNIVCLYQGKSESGPRALGNRSILYNPTDPNGKDFVNTIKKREWFRPFAGTVLKEHTHEWFDLAGMDESPFMMYAVDVLHPDKIPAITHVDGTCRIQTLTKEQNHKYYEIIEEFYKLTDVPMVFNTSFNLAGEPIVDSLDDALYTLRNSDMKYLYLAEYGMLISK